MTLAALSPVWFAIGFIAGLKVASSSGSTLRVAVWSGIITGVIVNALTSIAMLALRPM